MENKKKNPVASIILTLICILWMYPIVLILVNSLKKEVAITTSGVFSLPTAETWNGVANFVASVTQMDFLKSFWYSLVISVMSVVLIMLCCSMAAWYIVRVNGTLSKVFYYLCVFSMVVPFQMVMFTLAKTADTLHLNNPYNICIIYLGFGAGLAVFMFTGFVKGIPLEIEEAALIDGCTPLQVYFKVLIPILKPTIISYHSDGSPVFPRKLRTCADGTDDGKYHDRYHSDHCCLSGMPETHYRRCCSRRSQRLIIT